MPGARALQSQSNIRVQTAIAAMRRIWGRVVQAPSSDVEMIRRQCIAHWSRQPGKPGAQRHAKQKADQQRVPVQRVAGTRRQHVSSATSTSISTSTMYQECSEASVRSTCAHDMIVRWGARADRVPDGREHIGVPRWPILQFFDTSKNLKCHGRV